MPAQEHEHQQRRDQKRQDGFDDLTDGNFRQRRRDEQSCTDGRRHDPQHEIDADDHAEVERVDAVVVLRHRQQQRDDDDQRGQRIDQHPDDQ